MKLTDWLIVVLSAVMLGIIGYGVLLIAYVFGG